MLLGIFGARAQQPHPNVATCHCGECMRVKIGQMIMTSMDGTVEITPLTQQAIVEYGVGGVVLFEKNISVPLGEPNPQAKRQLAERHSKMQQLASKYPLFISIDHEGGLVNRLKAPYDFPPAISAHQLAEYHSQDSTRKWARGYAKTLKEIGVNLNYAPTVDMIIDPRNTISARGRCFSGNADSVALQAQWWIEEFGKERVLSAPKHFPGHGSSLVDSHNGLTDITNTWNQRELTPYKKLIDNGFSEMIMVGHLFNERIDKNYPASLSKKTIDGMLRGELGFEGVIITDALNMAAITQNYKYEDAIVLGVNSGADMLMIVLGDNVSVGETVEIIEKALQDGRIAPETIDQAFARIVRLKERLSIFRTPLYTVK